MPIDENRKTSFINWGGEIYETDLVSIEKIFSLNGELSYYGKMQDRYFEMVVGNKKYGPFSGRGWFSEDKQFATFDNPKEGTVVIDLINDKVHAVFQNFWVNHDERKIDYPLIVSTGDQVAVSAVAEKGGEIVNYVISDKIISEIPTMDSGPYIINRELAYLKKVSDNISQFVIGGKSVEPVYEGEVLDVEVSEGGRIAVLLAWGIQTELYVDGVLVNDSSEKVYDLLGFFEEEFAYKSYKDGKYVFTYGDIEVIGKGLTSTVSEFELIGGEIYLIGISTKDYYKYLVTEPREGLGAEVNIDSLP